MGTPSEVTRRRALALFSLAVLAACAPRADRPADPVTGKTAQPMIDGNLDTAEVRWRKQIEAERRREDALVDLRSHADDADDVADLPPARDPLLTDDPAKPPTAYGTVALDAGVDPAAETPRGFWSRVRAGADTVGRASFAVVSVMVTIGMMVAPYLLL